jgi:REP element-mobilizing transposase RayT
MRRASSRRPCRITCTCRSPTDPQRSIHRLVKQIKRRNSHLLRQEFPTLRSRLPTLWTNSYLVATVGDPTPEVVKRNVENQCNVEDTGTPLPPHG